MEYKKIKSQNLSIEELREIWCTEYCKPENPIYTFDKVLVKFYEDMFDHAFFESANWKHKDKSILSLNRCSKMLWIKTTLEDPEANLKQGYDKKTKTYSDDRRVALVKGNYIVIIRFVRKKEAKFITAFDIDDDETLRIFNGGPEWAGQKKWL